jgi:hypothetical protein
MHVDAGVEQFQHVLPAPFVTAAGCVAVREFVDERERRAAREHRVEIEFGERTAGMFDTPPRQLFEAIEQGRRVGAAVRFDDADDDVDAAALEFRARPSIA